MSDALRLVGLQLADFVAPLTSIGAAEDKQLALIRVLRSAGWLVRTDLDLGAVVESVETIGEQVDALIETDFGEDLDSFANGVKSASRVVASCRDLAGTFAGLDGGNPTSGEVALLAEDIVQSLAISWLRRRPLLETVAYIAGAIETSESPAAGLGGDAGWLQRPDATVERFVPARFVQFFNDPIPVVQQLLFPNDWAASEDAAVTMTILAGLLEPLVREADGTWELHPDRYHSIDDFRLTGREALIDFRTSTESEEFRLGSGLEFLSGQDQDASGRGGPAVLFEPFGHFEYSTRAGGWLLAFAIGLAGDADSAPTIRIDGGGVTANAADFGITAELEASFPVGATVGGKNTALELGVPTWRVVATANHTGTDIAASVLFEDSKIRISSADVGGFVHALASFDAEVDFALGLEWSQQGGLRLTGGASLELALADDIDIAGIVKLTNLRARVELGERMSVGVRSNLRANVGPLSIAMEGIAVGASMTGGDFGFGLTPPNGISVAIKSDLVTGGGFISYDPDRGRYSGGLQLKIASISVTAIGVLDTRDVDGEPLPSPGFSFLVLIAAEFPAIQVGFGFTLSGIGGLVGIYRRSDYDALQAGLRTGALDSVLFPADPIAEADRVISDLTALFPPAAHRYIIGPMLRLGWGGIIDLEVGVLLLLGGPVKIQLLGQLSANLPNPDDALISLNLDIIGEVDFAAGTVRLDAALRDSHIVGFPLTGDLAARARWKQDPMFGLSFGGFHPDYRPHAAFPSNMRRLALSISKGSNLRISAESYFAVTSNTVQFGNRAELRASAAGFSVEGYFEAHMLVVFSPFAFAATVSMRVALRYKSISIASISLHFELSGPRPWRVKGRLRLKVFFITVKLGFNISWGNSSPIELPTRSVWTELEAALRNPENWTSELPPHAELGVTLLPRPATSELAVHPNGVLSVRQNVVPFGVAIERFGNSRPDTDGHHFSLPEPTSSSIDRSGVLSEHFAPGQFRDLRDDERLSSPSFELLPAGVKLGSTAVGSGRVMHHDITYETQILEPAKPARAPFTVDVLEPDVVVSKLQVHAESRARRNKAGVSRYRNASAEPAIALNPDRPILVNGFSGVAARRPSPSTLLANDLVERYRSLGELVVSNTNETP